MRDRRAFAAAIGFAFVAAWIAFGFGEAILCLLGAAVFWAVAAVIEGDVDLGQLQGRFTGRGEEDLPTAPTRKQAPSARAGGEPRVR